MHVTFDVSDGGIGVSCAIVEEVVDVFLGSFGRLGLVFGDGVEGGEHGRVHSASIEEEGSDNLLDEGLQFFVECGRDVDMSILLIFSVHWFVPWMWCILHLLPNMFEAAEAFGDVAWHGKRDDSIFVVPGERDSTEQAAGPVDSNCVFFFEGGDEIFCIFFARLFYSKVVDDETELEVLGVVTPESWSVAAWFVSMRVEVFLEAFIRN